MQQLSTSDPGFERAFARLLAPARSAAADVRDAVAGIIADVRARGDAALIALTERFDGPRLTPETLAFSPDEIAAQAALADPADVAALELAAARIRACHERQLPAAVQWTDAAGVGLGWRWTPVDAAGLYVPGGLASYPSSLLMNAIPARVAGVGRLAVAVPSPGGAVNPLVMAAAQIAGIDEIWRIGGAQAVAALAYGTATIRPVRQDHRARQRLCGRGQAPGLRRCRHRHDRRAVRGAGDRRCRCRPGLDRTRPAGQAEHDARAQAVLITDDPRLADAVASAVDARLATLSRTAIAGTSWRDHGAIVTVRDLDEAAELANRIAPEHLELAVADPEALAARITHAGAIFLGPWTPEVAGDYAAGPNHVLPTAGSARFSSGLSVLDFMKRTTLLRLDPGSLGAIGPAAARLARAEGLEAHALSVEARLQRLNEGGA
jgi:histidinol dehydrogenase